MGPTQDTGGNGGGVHMVLLSILAIAQCCETDGIMHDITQMGEGKTLTDGAVGTAGASDPPTRGRMDFSDFLASPKGFVRMVILSSCESTVLPAFYRRGDNSKAGILSGSC